MELLKIKQMLMTFTHCQGHNILEIIQKTSMFTFLYGVKDHSPPYLEKGGLHKVYHGTLIWMTFDIRQGHQTWLVSLSTA